jgi:hypothetical protein
MTPPTFCFERWIRAAGRVTARINCKALGVTLPQGGLFESLCFAVSRPKELKYLSRLSAVQTTLPPLHRDALRTEAVSWCQGRLRQQRPHRYCRIAIVAALTHELNKLLPK